MCAYMLHITRKVEIAVWFARGRRQLILTATTAVDKAVSWQMAPHKAYYHVLIAY